MDNYNKVIVAMQELAAKRINNNGVWDSKSTNVCIKLVLKRFGVDESIRAITGNDDIGDYANIILIEDLLSVFSVSDVMILLYYTYDIEQYHKLVDGIEDSLIQDKYCTLTETLTDLVLKISNRFTIDDSIKSIIGKQYHLESQEQARILWFNKLITMPTLCKYGYLYSEEFADYIIDHILHRSRFIDGNPDERKDYLNNIYTILECRMSIPHSTYFKEKNKNIINQVCKIHVSRAYSLERCYKAEGDEE